MQSYPQARSGIRRKITLIVFFSSLLTIAVGIGLVYFLGSHILRDTIVSDYSEIARILGEDISDLINRQVDSVTKLSKDRLWQEEVAQANLRYKDMSEDAIQAYLSAMDLKWHESAKDLSLSNEYADNPLSLGLREIASEDNDIVRMSVADYYGGLVADSDLGSNFSQRDTDWWRSAFASGAGKIYVGNAFFDEASADWAIPVAVPVRDESSRLTGVCEIILSTKRFFAKLRGFRLGPTARAVLADESGEVIESPKEKTFTAKFIGEEGLQRLLSSKNKFEIVPVEGSPGEKRLVVFSEIKLPFILGNQAVRRVFIDQNVREVLAPVRRLTGTLTIVFTILLFFLALAAFITGGIFVKPIRKLQLAAKRIAAGNLDYKINIKTDDEIEEFADYFSLMVSRLKNNQAELVKAKDALEELAKSLEVKVVDRTKQLHDAMVKLEDALGVKSRFTSVVSHELRTPLAAIKESISVVLEKIAGDLNSDQEKCLSIAARNVDRLVRMVNEVLDFQKLEAGKMAFHMRENDLNEVAREVAETMASVAKEKGIQVILNLQDNLPKVMFDKDRITQVLINLVNNSIKFTEQGDVTISTKSGENIVQVTVKDTGRGIKNDDMPKLFKDFSQIDSGEGKKSTGTGLGLAISLEIIQAHHGKIWPESTFGEGTTVHFILPIKERRKEYAEKDIIH